MKKRIQELTARLGWSLVPWALLVVFFFVWILVPRYCRTNIPARNEFGSLPVIQRSDVDSSYLLFSPFAMSPQLSDPGVVYLTDLNGKALHTWKTLYQVMFSSLKKNGNLVVEMIKPADLLKNPGGGGTGILQELDWRGNVVWQYENPMLHHDFDVLPEGGVAALVWEQVPHEQAARIRGGKNVPGDTETWSDAIIEVDQGGNEVWRWSAHEHLDLSRYELGSLTPKSEWTHGNSVRYYDTNPFSGDPIYLVSLRHLNRVVMIERSTGAVLWESEEGLLSYQHDATFLENGNILAFDNGLFRDQERPFLWSRVVEIDPRTNKIVWEFNGGKTGPEKAKFSPSIMSGAQRLKNGNTLIIDSVRGHLFEVTKDRRIVWDFINPYLAPSSGSFSNNIVFKARRYLPTAVDWPEVLAPPLPKPSHVCSIQIQ